MNRNTYAETWIITLVILLTSTDLSRFKIKTCHHRFIISYSIAFTNCRKKRFFLFASFRRLRANYTFFIEIQTLLMSHWFYFSKEIKLPDLCFRLLIFDAHFDVVNVCRITSDRDKKYPLAHAVPTICINLYLQYFFKEKKRSAAGPLPITATAVRELWQVFPALRWNFSILSF